MEIDNLNHQYRILQKTCHPDRFIDSTDAEKKQSLLKSAEINDAYQTLKDPIKRASHIINLHKKITEEVLPTEFLMQQIEWEEELEELIDLDKLNVFLDKINDEKISIINLLTDQLDEKKDWKLALSLIGKLKFISKFYSKIQQKIFAMDLS